MSDGTSPPQVWHRYGMKHLINVVWFDPRVNNAQSLALDDAWDTLVVRDEWRDWVQTYRTPHNPFLVLVVAEEIKQRRLRKIKNGASMKLPSAEVFRADADGTLVPLYLGVIYDLHLRWAERHGHPGPPDAHPAD